MKKRKPGFLDAGRADLERNERGRRPTCEGAGRADILESVEKKVKLALL